MSEGQEVSKGYQRAEVLKGDNVGHIPVGAQVVHHQGRLSLSLAPYLSAHLLPLANGARSAHEGSKVQAEVKINLREGECDDG